MHARRETRKSRRENRLFLPREILAIIADFARGKRSVSTLCNLSLVSHTWYEACRPLLQEQVLRYYVWKRNCILSTRCWHRKYQEAGETTRDAMVFLFNQTWHIQVLPFGVVYDLLTMFFQNEEHRIPVPSLLPFSGSQRSDDHDHLETLLRSRLVFWEVADFHPRLKRAKTLFPEILPRAQILVCYNQVFQPDHAAVLDCIEFGLFRNLHSLYLLLSSQENTDVILASLRPGQLRFLKLVVHVPNTDFEKLPSPETIQSVLGRKRALTLAVSCFDLQETAQAQAPGLAEWICSLKDVVYFLEFLSPQMGTRIKFSLDLRSISFLPCLCVDMDVFGTLMFSQRTHISKLTLSRVDHIHSFPFLNCGSCPPRVSHLCFHDWTECNPYKMDRMYIGLFLVGLQPKRVTYVKKGDFQIQYPYALVALVYTLVRPDSCHLLPPSWKDFLTVKNMKDVAYKATVRDIYAGQRKKIKQE